MSNPDKRKGTGRKSLQEELVEYSVIFAYLALVSRCFHTVPEIRLAAHDITYTNYWVGLIEALILPKVIMIGAVLRLGRGFEE